MLHKIAKFQRRFYGLGHHHKNVCNILRLCGAISYLAFNNHVQTWHFTNSKAFFFAVLTDFRWSQ